MNKKSKSHLSIEKTRRSHKTLRTKGNLNSQSKPRANWAQLTDLCPEEKQKIGELIRVLQERRVENETLREENSCLAMKVLEYEERIKEADIKLREKGEQLDRLGMKLIEMEQACREAEAKQYQQEREKMNIKQFLEEAEQISSSVQTVALPSKGVGVQADGGGRAISWGTQTHVSGMERGQMSMRTAQHSRSFEKIMKMPLPTVTYSPDSAQSRPRKSMGIRQYLQQTQELSKERDESEQDEAGSSNSCGSLSKQWKQLKEESRESLRHKNTVRLSGDSARATNSGMVTRKPTYKAIDQGSLNKLLKSKNFSASKLVRLGDTACLREQQKESKEESKPEVNYLKSPFISQQANTIPTPQPSKDGPLSSSRQINFFESDLLEVGSYRASGGESV